MIKYRVTIHWEKSSDWEYRTHKYVLDDSTIGGALAQGLAIWEEWLRQRIAAGEADRQYPIAAVTVEEYGYGYDEAFLFGDDPWIASHS